jgi:cytochrome P450
MNPPIGCFGPTWRTRDLRTSRRSVSHSTFCRSRGWNRPTSATPCCSCNETTGRLIGWLAKVLAEHPDQRSQIAEDRTLLDRAVDETLRYEPTGPHVARYILRDFEAYRTTVPAGSSMLLLFGAANRDPARYDNPDTFDIHRDNKAHLTFGKGLHYCLGANLARLEGRVALDELLNRFPEWDIDYDDIKPAPTSTVRGWERLRIVLP